LPVLPEIYPRGLLPPRNAVEIQGVPLEAISERISTFMRLNSIQCYYDTERGRVIASTTYVPKFVVQLWRRRRNADDTSSSDSIIVVDVQRRLGCSIGMHRIKKSLVRSIQTGDYHSERASRRNFRIPSRTIIIKKAAAAAAEDQRKKLLDDDLEICVALLGSGRVDQKRLGIESLCVLTDPSKVYTEHAHAAARALVYGQGDQGDRLQHEFENYLHGLVHEEQEEGAGAGHDGQLCHAFQALSTSLDILVNLTSEDGKGLLHFCHPSDCLSVFWHNVTRILVRTLETARANPHSAAIAARIIRILETHAPKELKPLSQHESLPLLVHAAYLYGRAFHSILEQETQLLLQDYIV
jgi:hypothetical protein